MQCKGCGSGWFVERKHVQPLDLEPPPLGPVTPRRARFSYRCEECGLAFGDVPPKPKKVRKPRSKEVSQT